MSEPRQPSRIKNLSLAAIAGLAGIVVVIIVVASLLLGMWLDAQTGRRGPFTVGVVVLSIPITLFVVFRLVLWLVSAIQPPPKDEQDTSHRGG